MKDAEWIAQIARCGLIEPSYIPAPEVVQLRLLTRRMRSYKWHQTQVKNGIYNLLQRANIKLTSYLSDIFSKTGQALLKLLINGETINVESVIPCIQKRVKASPEELVEATEGKLSLERPLSLRPELRGMSDVSGTHWKTDRRDSTLHRKGVPLRKIGHFKPFLVWMKTVLQLF